MRHRIHLILAAAAIVSGPARAGEGDPPKVRPEMVQIFQSEFRYAPALPRQLEANPPPREGSPTGDTIALPRLTVLASRINMRDLGRDILQHQAQAEAQKPKWGCGPTFQKDFGKVRFGVISIFYIPVAIGFSW
jgi:hypothetical protein